MAEVQSTNKPPVPKLRLRELAALNEYWRNGFNAAEAGFKAGYTGKHTHHWLRRPAVQIELEVRRKTMRTRFDVTEDFIVQRLANLADINTGQVMKKLQDNDYDLSCLTFDEGYAIDKFTEEFYTEGRGERAREVKKVTLKLSDKLGPLVTLAKKLGLLTEKVEHSGEVSMVDRIINARSIEKTADEPPKAD